MADVERVAATRVIHVVARIVLHQPIVGSIVHAAQRKRRPQMIALRRVVVDDIENHFQAGGMEIS